MQPGPTNYYKCPKCENVISRESLRSGNTMAAKLYSDGKMIAPMMPEFPEITRCSKCKTIFWIDKAELAGTSDPFILDREEFINSEEAGFLTIIEYKEALTMGSYSDIGEEKFLRIRAWWTFNDRVRNKEELFLNENEKSFWYENSNRLLELLNNEDTEDKIRIAELNRNMENFENCMEVMDSIKDENYEWVKVKLRDECIKKNDKVIQLTKL